MILSKVSLLLITVCSLLVSASDNSVKSVIVYPLSSICKEFNNTPCIKQIAILDPVTLETNTLDIQSFSPVMSPDGDRIAFHAGRHNQMTVDVMDVKSGIRATLVDTTENPTYLSWSHNGSYLAYTASVGDYNAKEKVYVVERSGRNKKQISGDLEVFSDIEWSPTEEKLVFSARERYEVTSSLYIYDLKRHEITRIDSSIGYIGNATWSPDGREIAFDSDRDGSHQVYTVDLETGNVSQLTSGTDEAVYPQWAFGGTHIIVSAYGSTKDAFQIIELETQTITLIPPTGNMGSSDVSPDGDELVYVRVALTDSHLCIINLNDFSERCLDVKPYMSGDVEWVSVPAD